MADPLTPEEERAYRSMLALGGEHWPGNAVDRLLATLDAARALAAPPVPAGLDDEWTEPHQVRMLSANCGAGDHDDCASMVEQDDAPGLGITDCLCPCHAARSVPAGDDERAYVTNYIEEAAEYLEEHDGEHS